MIEIIVGRPFAIASAEIPKWECPLYIQGMTQGVMQIWGVGPVDALLNATTIVKGILAGLPDATPMEGHAPRRLATVCLLDDAASEPRGHFDDATANAIPPDPVCYLCIRSAPHLRLTGFRPSSLGVRAAAR
jgi:hypothetical protein